jgi:hypothetical protein
MRQILLACALLVLLPACGPHVFRHPELANRDLYLCCNFWVSRRHTVSDANYSTYYVEREGAMLPAGTRVRVVDDETNELTLQFESLPGDFSFAFQFGRARMAAGQYFRLILLDENPRTAMSSWPPDVVAAIDEARVQPGMTKEQTLMARGYPPFHHTPGIEADEWMYYDSPGFVTIVQFVDGRVAAFRHETAPGQ